MWRIGNGMLNCSPWFGILCIAGSPFCQKFGAQLMQFLVFFKGLDAMEAAMLFSAVSERHIKKSFKKNGHKGCNLHCCYAHQNKYNF